MARSDKLRRHTKQPSSLRIWNLTKTRPNGKLSSFWSVSVEGIWILADHHFKCIAWTRPKSIGSCITRYPGHSWLIKVVWISYMSLLLSCMSSVKTECVTAAVGLLVAIIAYISVLFWRQSVCACFQWTIEKIILRQRDSRIFRVQVFLSVYCCVGFFPNFILEASIGNVYCIKFFKDFPKSAQSLVVRISEDIALLVFFFFNLSSFCIDITLCHI